MSVTLDPSPPFGWTASSAGVSCPGGTGSVTIDIPEWEEPGQHNVAVQGKIDGVQRCSGNIDVTVIGFDLGVDSDNDGDIDDADDDIEMDDFAPHRPGLVLWPNNDDSNGDLAADFHNLVVDGEADLADVIPVWLRPVTITGLASPRLFIEYDNPAVIRLFDRRAAGAVRLPARRELLDAWSGQILGVEGLVAGRATISVILEDGGVEICRDDVHVTVVDLAVSWRYADGVEITEPNAYWSSDPPGQPPQGPYILGVRHFPGATEPDGGWNDQLIVRVATVPAVDTSLLSNVAVYLKAIDPDDPSADRAENVVDGTSPLTGNDNRGQSAGLGAMEIETGPEGWGETTFAVAHQPGDNHRVAASLKQVALATVTHENVPPSRMETGQQATEDQVPLFIGNISPLLTIWRRLHVETDAMLRPTFQQNTISGCFWDNPHWNGSNQFIIDICNQDVHDDFENGWVRIQAAGFPDLVTRIITYQQNTILHPDRFFLNVNPSSWGSRPIQGSCIFSDDDLSEEANFLAGIVGSDVGIGDPSNGGFLPLPDTSNLAIHFGPAYISPLVEVEHTSTNIPFRKYIFDIEQMSGWSGIIPFRGPSRSCSQYWHSYIYSAFQAEQWEDFDGEQKATKGISTHRENIFGNTPTTSALGPTYNGMCAIFVESLDDGFGVREHRITVAHEIAHTLGVDHTTQLMHKTEQTNEFSCQSLTTAAHNIWTFFLMRL